MIKSRLPTLGQSNADSKSAGAKHWEGYSMDKEYVKSSRERDELLLENDRLRESVAAVISEIHQHQVSVEVLTKDVDALKAEGVDLRRVKTNFQLANERLKAASEKHARFEAEKKAKIETPLATKRVEPERTPLQEAEFKKRDLDRKVQDFQAMISSLENRLHEVEHKRERILTKSTNMMPQCEAAEVEFRRLCDVNKELKMKDDANQEVLDCARAANDEIIAAVKKETADVDAAREKLMLRFREVETEMMLIRKRSSMQKMQTAVDVYKQVWKKEEETKRGRENPRLLGINVKERDARRSEKRAKIDELYKQFVVAKAEEGDPEKKNATVETLRKQIENMGIRAATIDNEDGKFEEEEDEVEFTADELVDRIQRLRVCRNKWRDEVDVVKAESATLRGKEADQKWRLEIMAKAIQAVVAKGAITGTKKLEN